MKKKKKKAENSERWLLTYSDLITLLMILFVLLFSISNVNQTKYKQLAESLNGALGKGGNSSGILSGGNGILKGSNSLNIETNTEETKTAQEETKTSQEETKTSQEETKTSQKETKTSQEESKSSITSTNGDSETQTEKNNMQNLNSDINNVISDYNLGNSAESKYTERGVVITFSNEIFFDAGDTVLKNDMKDALYQIALNMNKIDNTILIEGFTDNIPINNSKYSSNWQLSAIRAANVVQFLVDKGHVKGSRLVAVGYGENHPIASNKTKKGRSRNRRINIVVLNN